MSSCYLLDSHDDRLEGIYDKYKDVAMLSKFAGGVGLAFHPVRSRGLLIRATNGHSKGIVPWLKTLDSDSGSLRHGDKSFETYRQSGDVCSGYSCRPGMFRKYLRTNLFGLALG
jgi:hypothetical protein